MTSMFQNLWHLSPFFFLMPFAFIGALVTGGAAAVVRARTWHRGSDDPHDRWLSLAASVFFWIGLGLASAAIVERYIAAGRPPFKTLYESLVLLAATTSLIYIIIELRYRHPLLSIPAALMLIGISVYAATQVDIEIVELPAALQSPWFVPHVVVYFLGYGALAVAAVAAVGFLIAPDFELHFWSISGSRRHRLDEIMHRLNILGYILLTVGLLMGAWWAKTAWGDWWSWDPKENWALVSWLAYTLYFHLRLLKGWSSRKMAALTIIAFVTVIFTYLGIALLPTGEMSEHVYQ